jgi:hypothetical protein
MPAVSVERLPVQLFGLGFLGFDHLQIVFRNLLAPDARQDDWFVIEGLREQDGADAHLAVEGWQGGTTLSEANGGLVGEELERKIGTSASRGTHDIAGGSEAISLWARLVSFAADIDAQMFPYIPIALPSSPLPTINSSSLVASLLHHAGLSVADALPSGLRLSPGMATLLGTSGDDTLAATGGFTTLAGGAGNDLLVGGGDAGAIDKLYGGAGNDTLRWSPGTNVLHGGQPGLAYAEDGRDTVDYSGAGEIRVEALPAGAPHRQPDFVVTHATGRDYLFSIEEILWDGARDNVTLGEGVALAARPADLDASRGLPSTGLPLPSTVPEGPLPHGPDLGLFDSGGLGVPLADDLPGAAAFPLFELWAGG